MDTLLTGGCILKKVVQELTCHDLDDPNDKITVEHLWSILFTAGYLTLAEKAADGDFWLVIPNREVLKIFETQVMIWFQRKVTDDQVNLKQLYRGFQSGDVVAVQEKFNFYLSSTISILDTRAKKTKKENFYHGVLSGLFRSEPSWYVRSNEESGTGFCDILVEIENSDKRTFEIGLAVELKYAENGAFESGCREAMQQIEDRDYAAKLRMDGMKTIYAYGIACYKKECRVVCKQMEV